MSYFHARLIPGDFETIVKRTRAALQKHGFGVLTEIDIQATLKAKIRPKLCLQRTCRCCSTQLGA